MTVCNFKWAFFLLHQSWFLIVPGLVIAVDFERGNKPPFTDVTIVVWNMAKTQIATRKRFL